MKINKLKESKHKYKNSYTAYLMSCVYYFYRDFSIS